MTANIHQKLYKLKADNLAKIVEKGKSRKWAGASC